MPLIRLASAAIAGLLLAGCVSQTSYDTSREALRGSPALRSDFVRECTGNITRKPLAQRQAMAKLMNTSVRNTPRLYCQRVTSGITSGRLSRADINAGAMGRLTPGVVRVLQGR